MREQHDTVVIGGGQAGLAMSAVLQRHGREHVVLERGQVGGRWQTERWDSLRFQFPNWSLELPGFAYSGDDPYGFAHWREILHLIEDYAASTAVPVREHTEVTGLTSDDDGFVLSVPTARSTPATSSSRPVPSRNRASRSSPATFRGQYCKRTRRATGVRRICPTAPCWWSAAVRPAARSLTSSSGPSARCSCRCLGTGASRGEDVYWWLERMGRFAQTIDSFPGRQWPPGIVVTGVSGGYDVDVRQMANEGLRVLGRVPGVSDDRLAVASNGNEILDEADATFAGFVASAREFVGASPAVDLAAEEAMPEALSPRVAEVESLDLRRENVATIVWATGYDYDYGWLKAPVLDAQGRPLQHRGVTPVPGVYFLGLHWMHTIKSGPALRCRRRRRVPRRAHQPGDRTMTEPGARAPPNAT